VRRRNNAILLALVLVLVACAAPQLPPGYERLQPEANLVIAARYLDGLRASYKEAYRQGRLDKNRYILAIQADETLSVAWDTLHVAVAARQDNLGTWAAVLDGLSRLESIICAWVPDPQVCKRPVALGGK